MTSHFSCSLLGKYFPSKRTVVNDLWSRLSMPGNEVADKVHNFFEQDNLSQGQHQSQVPGGNWPLPNSNLWVGSQRQVGTQLASNLKTYGVQQSGDEL